MSTAQTTSASQLRQQKVLAQLQSGLCTWEQLRSRTKINEEQLGYTLGELLNLRKIWTGERGEVRVYGIERRTDLMPRFTHPHRRSSDATA
jgi:hypothetical protein